MPSEAALRGFSSGANLVLNRRQLEQREQETALATTEARRRVVGEEQLKLMNTASEAGKAMIAGGAEPPEVSRVLGQRFAPAFKALEESLSPFGEQGLARSGTVQFEGLLNQIALAPSPSQLAEAQAQAGAAGEMAGAEALGLSETPTQQAFRAGETDIQATEALTAQRQAASALDRARTETARSGGEALTAAMQLRLQKIADAMRLQNLDEAAATALVDGQNKTQVDPASGRVFNVGPDLAAEDITPPRAQVPLMDEAGRQVSVEEMSAATGVGAVVQEAAAKTLGQISPFFVAQDTTEARTALRTLKNRLLFALSLSGRPPVIEQQRILDLLPSEGVMESEPRAKAVFEQLRGDLVQVRNADAKTINAGAVGPQDEQSLRARIAEIDQIIERLAPQEERPAGDEDRSSDGGPSPEEIGRMNRDELSRLNMENMTGKQLRAASKAWDANGGDS